MGSSPTKRATRLYNKTIPSTMKSPIRTFKYSRSTRKITQQDKKKVWSVRFQSQGRKLNLSKKVVAQLNLFDSKIVLALLLAS